jgi:hypothetical protein
MLDIINHARSGCSRQGGFRSLIIDLKPSFIHYDKAPVFNDVIKTWS